MESADAAAATAVDWAIALAVDAWFICGLAGIINGSLFILGISVWSAVDVDVDSPAAVALAVDSPMDTATALAVESASNAAVDWAIALAVDAAKKLALAVESAAATAVD